MCKKVDLVTIQGKAEKFDIVEQFTQERQNTNWRFNLIFAVFHNGMPGLCPTRVFYTTYASELFLCNKTRNLTKNNFVFRRIGHVNEEAQWSRLLHFSKLYRFITKSCYDPKKYRGVSVEEMPFFEEIVQRNLKIYDFDIQEYE